MDYELNLDIINDKYHGNDELKNKHINELTTELDNIKNTFISNIKQFKEKETNWITPCFFLDLFSNVNNNGHRDELNNIIKYIDYASLGCLFRTCKKMHEISTIPGYIISSIMPYYIIPKTIPLDRLSKFLHKYSDYCPMSIKEFRYDIYEATRLRNDNIVYFYCNLIPFEKMGCRILDFIVHFDRGCLFHDKILSKYSGLDSYSNYNINGFILVLAYIHGTPNMIKSVIEILKNKYPRLDIFSQKLFTRNETSISEIVYTPEQEIEKNKILEAKISDLMWLQK